MPVMLPDVASLFESRSNGDTSALHLDSCHGPTFFQASNCVEIMPPLPRLTETNKRCDLIPSQFQRPKWWQLAGKLQALPYHANIDVV
jgi:hypothetical protein